MDISEIIRLVCAVVFTLSICCAFFLLIGLTYKIEKEHKELLNQELRDRIDLFNTLKDLYSDN